MDTNNVENRAHDEIEVTSDSSKEYMEEIQQPSQNTKDIENSKLEGVIAHVKKGFIEIGDGIVGAATYQFKGTTLNPNVMLKRH